ncbi:MAG: hypothetical protein ISR55_06310 [Bacteroidetes bacterium]|nr:hypothetical protein [Bacteroidota bacterium]
MKKLLLTVIFGLAVSTFLFAQVKPNNSQMEGKKTEKSRGVDANIVAGKTANSANHKSSVVQPPNKGAEQSRGGYCMVLFVNWTDYYIDCYVNGYYEGYMSPWGEASMTVSGGNTKLYGVAEFDDGSRLTWGPDTKYCYNQEWTCDLF